MPGGNIHEIVEEVEGFGSSSRDPLLSDLKEARNPRRTCKKVFSETSQRSIHFAPEGRRQIGLDVSNGSSTIQS